MMQIDIEVENTDKIIFLSPTYKKECLENFVQKEKTVVIPNGINKFWIDNLVCSKKGIKR